MSKDTKSFTLDPDVVEELEQTGNASKIVNDLLQEYFLSAGDGPIGLELQLQNTEKQISEAMDEREKLNRRIERLRRKKQRLEKEIEQRQQAQREKLAEAKQFVQGKEPDNPAVQNWADKLGMPPYELLGKVEELEA